jgi:methanogenic corrinoid protein MtbC1
MQMTCKVPVLNLGAVVEQTGVQGHTLRAWERRYGLPQPGRSGGGHRLYSRRDVDIIRWLSDRLDEGLSISRAVVVWKQLLAAGQDPLRPAPTTAPPVPPAGATLGALRRAWVESCLAFDEVLADQTVLEAFALLDPETVIGGVLQQGLSQIGELWYAGKASVQQEHLATELAVRRVESLIAAVPPPSRPGLIVTASPPEEFHSFSLLLVALLLRRRGWNVLHLGADVPLARLEQTRAAQRPDLVISAAQQLPTAATMLEMARRLHSQGIAMAYGGWVFNHIP